MLRRTAIVIDLVLVILFAMTGRASHDESIAPAGTAQTAWPFLVGAVVGWAVVAVRSRRTELAADGATTGLILWACTLVVGMGLRLASGDTAEIPFVIVATIVIGLLLNGWRLVARRVRRTTA